MTLMFLRQDSIRREVRFDGAGPEYLVLRKLKTIDDENC